MYRENPSFNQDEREHSADLPASNDVSSVSLQHIMLEQLLEASPAFICVHDQIQDRCLYASANMKQLFGYDHDAFIGKSSRMMSALVLDADSEKVMKSEIDLIEAATNFPPAERKNVKSIMNYRIKRADGSIAWVQHQKTIFGLGNNGEPSLVMSLVTDISVTRKCHEFFSSIVYRDERKGWTELGAEHSEQKLSNREAQILALLSKGKSSKIIANELSISVNTVNNHRKNMLLKTGTNNIAELVSYGLSQGVI